MRYISLIYGAFVWAYLREETSMDYTELIFCVYVFALLNYLQGLNDG